MASRWPNSGAQVAWGGRLLMDDYELAVDFMDITNDRRLWTRMEDARAGFVAIAGRHVIVGCDDADPAVARILSVNAQVAGVKWRSENIDLHDTAVLEHFCGERPPAEVRSLAFGLAFLAADMWS